MSIQTQIDRISGAVADALAALTEKGVTVPDGTTVDGLAALIAAIESGGGGKIAYGSFTLNTDTKDYVVTHDLGVVPTAVIYFVSNNGAITVKSAVVASFSKNQAETVFQEALTIYYNGSTYRCLVPSYSYIEKTSASGIMPSYGTAMCGTNTTFEICDSGDGSGLVLGSGLTYHWFAIGG